VSIKSGKSIWQSCNRPLTMDSWNGLRSVVTGMERQGYDVSLTRYSEGWRVMFIRRDHTMRLGWVRW
jgi:hypothetical protein